MRVFVRLGWLRSQRIQRAHSRSGITFCVYNIEGRVIPQLVRQLLTAGLLHK